MDYHKYQEGSPVIVSFAIKFVAMKMDFDKCL